MIECYFCHRKCDDADTACNAGWIPGFWDGNQDRPYPVCPDCTERKIEFHVEDQVWQLAEHLTWATEAESAQRAQAWLQAAALWKRAAELSLHPHQTALYEKNARWCEEMYQLV